MKKITTIALMLFTAFSYSQVGINTNNPDASSALEIESTTGGILIPRLTETQRDAIVSPASGLMIYQTDQEFGFYFYNGTLWTRMEGETGTQGLQGLQGPAGNDGAVGSDGSSAYEIWITAGNTGTEAEFLTSLVGAQGEAGPQGIQGINGSTAYELWQDAGNIGTEAEFLTSLVGPEGPLISGTNGQTLYNNGTEWVATSNLLNSGASVGIGLTATIDASAVLQIESTTQGVLFPKMTLEERDLISSPQIGLLVFQTDTTPGFYFYDGSSWVTLNAADGSSSGGSNPKTLIYTSQGF